MRIGTGVVLLRGRAEVSKCACPAVSPMDLTLIPLLLFSILFP